MKPILLINPRIGIYSKVFKPFLPLSLLAVSTLVEKAGYPVIILDQHVDKSWESTLRRILRQTPPILAGITSMTGTQLKGALRAAEIIRKESSVPIVWGGVHASLFPEGTLAHPNVDYIVIGEGEHTLLHLVNALENGGDLSGIPGLGYKSGDTFHITFRDTFENLDALPDIPYHLIDLKPYLHTYFWEKEVIEIESSRGCPFNCGFCYNEKYNRRKWRARSAENVLSTIRNLVHTFNITNILFIDDSFFIDPERVENLVSLLEREPYRIKMGFQGRISSVMKLSDDLLDRLIHVGAVFFQFGVESGSPRILKLINKQLTIPQVFALNERFLKYPGVGVFYNFMVGLPTETREDVLATVDVAWKLLQGNPNAFIGTIHIYKEYPGTPLYSRALNEGFSPPKTLDEWANYDWQSVVMRAHDPKLSQLCRAVSAASYCVDRKIEMLGDSRIAAIISDIYRPVARFRFKHKFFRWMPEARIFG